MTTSIIDFQFSKYSTTTGTAFWATRSLSPWWRTASTGASRVTAGARICELVSCLMIPDVKTTIASTVPNMLLRDQNLSLYIFQARGLGWLQTVCQAGNASCFLSSCCHKPESRSSLQDYEKFWHLTHQVLQSFRQPSDESKKFFKIGNFLKRASWDGQFLSSARNLTKPSQKLVLASSSAAWGS